MSLSGKQVVELARLFDRSHFTELRLQIGDFRLRVRRGDGGFVADEDDAAAAPAPLAAARANEVDVPAPLLGTFYHSPRPGDPPFVAPGDAVSEDSVFGIIEVMKLMNGVRAGVNGTVVALLAPNAEAVEAGQPLLRVAV